MGKQWKMAGKQIQSSKKGALFTKLSREIQVAVRLAGGQPEHNYRLRLALETARAHSLPKETIEKAIKKGSGEKSEDKIEEIIYEGFGPYGVAMIVVCLTDNRVRSISEMRFLFKKYKGNMGLAGSVVWMFDKVALIKGRPLDNTKDVEEIALLAGAEDIEQKEDSFLLYSSWKNFSSLEKNLLKQGWDLIQSKIGYRAKNPIQLSESQIKDIKKFLDSLEGQIDCQSVYTNVALIDLENF